MTSVTHVDTAALDRLLDPFDSSNAPGFAVGVALNGRPVFRRGVGLASVELPVVLSPSIRMRIGSTTKHFCALAIMLLVEEGKLTLDDSPRLHLPELPDWADRMTIRQLLAHTSGMRDSLDLLLHTTGPGMASEPDTQLRMLCGLDSVNFEPGTSWNYNNGGYVLLSEIVERLGGTSFADFLRERILEPVGMRDSQIRPLDTELLPNSATLHLPLPDGGWARGVFGPHILGEGGMVSTVDDMLLWLKHMSDPIVGTSQSWAEIMTPLTTHGYGLGLIIDKHRGLTTVHHAGGVIGGSCQMLKILDHDLDIIVMTNGRNALELYGLADAIIDACIPGLPPLPADEPRPPISGTYYSAQTGRVITLVEHEGAQAVSISGMTLPARREPDGTITVAILPTDLRIRPVDGEPVDALDAIEFGEADRLKRVEPPAGESLEDRLGSYRNAGANMVADLTDCDSGHQMRLAGELGSLTYDLHPIGPDLWEARSQRPMPLGGTLEFRENGLLLTTGRTVRLKFDRAG